MPPPERISAALARRVAIAATGLARPRPALPPVPRHLRAVLGHTALLQIDSVSVLARAHYLPLFSRLGPYDPALLDASAWSKRRWLFEYWAHEASLVPVAHQPLLRWRMARAAAGQGIYGELARFAAENRAVVDGALAHVERNGPTVAGALDGTRGAGGWWGWSPQKRALEFLFWAGALTTATRRGFERVYDLPARVLPAAVLAVPTPSPADAIRDLLAIAARALGVFTAGDLRDYHRLSPADALPRIAELAEAGEIVPVTVPGWKQAAWLHRDARLPRRVAARALLAPFDPLMWHRPRAARIFGFDYRLEIYTPAERRVHGYYVLPFLLGDRLVARVDLKADRPAGILRVLATHAEPDAPEGTAEALAAELAAMASWLGLGGIAVQPVGNLSGPLALVCG